MRMKAPSFQSLPRIQIPQHRCHLPQQKIGHLFRPAMILEGELVKWFLQPVKSMNRGEKRSHSYRRASPRETIKTRKMPSQIECIAYTTDFDEKVRFTTSYKHNYCRQCTDHSFRNATKDPALYPAKCWKIESEVEEVMNILSEDMFHGLLCAFFAK
jgi:hypothetical protein